MLPPAAERSKLASVLGQLDQAVEELLLSGLTTASETTRQTLTASMQEAARFKLLRLGSSLRGASDELGRYAKQETSFSRRRLTFFLNRSWLLSRGLAHALQSGDEQEYDRLNWTAPTKPLESIDVVCLGVVKKVTASAVLFEFRLRDVLEGQRLVWSAVFPVKPGVEVPAEGYLHLPQKQKFAPALFLDRKILTFRGATLSTDPSGTGRLALTETGTVTIGAAFTEWSRFLEWTPAASLERLKAWKPGPLDLDTELMEDVVLRDYDIGPPEEADDAGQIAYPLTAGPLQFRALVGAGVEGVALKKAIELLRKPKQARPPLFGLMHYERCRLVLQPLATIGTNGPEYLTISKESIDKAALLKAMKFT